MILFKQTQQTQIIPEKVCILKMIKQILAWVKISLFGQTLKVGGCG